MRPPRGPLLGAIYAFTVLLGAFLLFQVQPLLSKWILPWFGGGSAVWTTCLLFFQSALFAGYAYAHLSVKYLPTGVRTALHLGLIAAAAGLLPIDPGEGWKPGPSGDPTWGILLLLGAKVGAPFVLLSSTGPMVQAWGCRAYPERSPYRLFALSNAGSLAALLSYPLLFEPLWGLRTQSVLWMGAFLVFAVLYAAGTLADARRGGATAGIAADPTEGAPATAGRKVLWILLPAFGSWMLAATTRQLCEDMVVIPFLWILPLAVYLVTFILAFDRPAWYRPRIYGPGTVVLVFVAAGVSLIQSAFPKLYLLGLTVAVLALFSICMICHGELARLRPAPRHLTAYYLAISGGGALGSVWVTLVAPLLFSTLLEWKLGMVISYGIAWGVVAWGRREALRAHRVVAAVLLAIAGVGLSLIVALFGTYGRPLETVRNFYGVVGVVDAPRADPRGRRFRELHHGRILHGRQALQGGDRGRPTAYYVETSGVGRTLEFFRSREDLRVGMVGLGVGTLAAYGTLPSQSFRFYEINPAIRRLAETHFSYLKECRARVEVVLGDARLSLEREPPQRFHVLVLDAFSGDTIPMHLLTREAMGMYLGHLAPDGVIAVHITNRYLDLAPVVRGAAHLAGLKTLEFEYKEEGGDLGLVSEWIVCGGNDSFHQGLRPHAAATAGSREVVWTDDRSDLFSLLKFR